MCIGPGECAAILGPNGAGKSTLLRAIAGLLPLDSGDVIFDGVSVAGSGAAHLMGKGLVFVPQAKRVFPSLSVADNIQIMLHPLGRRDRRLRTEALHAEFPVLRERTRVLAGRLSSGEQQIVALARAMAITPRLLLLDEPSHGLSPLWVDRVCGHLKAIREAGVSIGIVEQNIDMAAELADRGYILRMGRVVRDMPAREFSQAMRDSSFA